MEGKNNGSHRAWGANPGKLDLPAADSRGNSSKYLRAGSNISGRRTADPQVAKKTLRVSLVCCVFCFWCFFYFDIFESVLYFCWLFLYSSIASMFHVATGILTIAYMMRLSGVLLGTFLLFSVHAWILQRSKINSSSSVSAKEPVIKQSWWLTMRHDVIVMASFHVRLCVVVVPETGWVAYAAWMRLGTLVCACFQLNLLHRACCALPILKKKHTRGLQDEVIFSHPEL